MKDVIDGIFDYVTVERIMAISTMKRMHGILVCWFMRMLGLILADRHCEAQMKHCRKSLEDQ